ncbi:MAG: AAA family ATPase, partial [Chloroflexi bacterium]|nr:AAA family ATPase [Chloroflexota bacterium]
VKRNPFKSKIFKRIQSDRDIRPEAASNSREVAASGQGATNLIQQFLTKATLPQEQVKQVLLVGLNSIFEPDSSFTEIDIKQHGEGPWEVFLFEPNKGRIPLSQSGSGLKTILLVLVLLHLVPPSENNKLNQYVFGFEELENNLHPALQRRLFLYLRKIALEKECVLFISTQSSVVIDLFSRDEHAQIIHVTHDGEKAKATRAVTYIQNKGILEDLDVRASDLLQSNGIVWVEGPSDRLYFNRWVEVWTDGELREGVHFQCVPYGGKLLAHLSGAEPDLENDLVKILRVNRNAILLLDSDRRQKGARLSATKLRLIKEMEELDGTPWVTYGREIEHYIPIEALKIRYPGNSIQPVGQFDSFADYLDKIKPGEGERFANNKVTFAAEILPYLAKENLNATSDLGSKLEVVCRLIRKWNSSRPPA